MSAPSRNGGYSWNRIIKEYVDLTLQIKSPQNFNKCTSTSTELSLYHFHTWQCWHSIIKTALGTSRILTDSLKKKRDYLVPKGKFYFNSSIKEIWNQCINGGSWVWVREQKRPLEVRPGGTLQFYKTPRKSYYKLELFQMTGSSCPF